MGIDRRAFLLAGSSAVLAARLPIVEARAVGGEGAAYLSCARSGASEAGGQFEAAGLREDGSIGFRVPLPGRGHGAAIAPDGRCAVVFARRPGRFALVLDPRSGTVLARIAPPADRRFSGHGFFSADGGTLYAAENDFEGERGVLGLYRRSRNFARADEIPTHGIGPHEAILLRHGRTAAVANGGILTHPDFPREKLNLSDMEPSLVILDLSTGSLIHKWAPQRALRQLSIRHLAEDREGGIWFGCQFEGPRGQDAPLVGRALQGQSIRWAGLDNEQTRRLRNYVGSVSALAGGGRIAVTSPIGGTLHIFDAASGLLLETHRHADICGVAPFGTGFLASDGTGAVWKDGDRLAAHAGWGWDNHLIRIAPGTAPFRSNI